jgi:hypothetical protein
MSITLHLPRLLLLLMLFNTYSHAREAYLRDVPSPFACTTCHEDPRIDRQGANIRNGFGFDYVAQRQDWAALCELDSDGDGITNAIELLDPDCEWRPAPAGQPNTPRPAGQATHPGDPDDPNQCGDALIQGSESCDGDNLDGATCASLGFLEGQLSCNTTCRFDQTDCVPLPTPDMSLMERDSAVQDMLVPDAQTFFIDAAALFEDAATDLALPNPRDATAEPLDSADSTDALLDAYVNETIDQGAENPAPSSAESGCTHVPSTAPKQLVLLVLFLVSLPRKSIFKHKHD